VNTSLDSTVTLRPTGPWRYAGAVFLAVWLAGWAIGEVFAVGAIAAIVMSAIPALNRIVLSSLPDTLTAGVTVFVFLFLLVWTTFWTIGGFAAFTRFLRDIAGEDRLQLVPTGIQLTRRAGPFRRVRTIDRGHVRRIRVRHHDQALVADTSSGAEFLTEFGTVDDRYAICRWLREGLRLPDEVVAPDLATAPPGWDAELAEDGSTRLTRRARRARPTQAFILWSVTGLIALGWIRGTPMDRFTGATVVAQVVTLLLATASAWLTWERSSWLAKPGRLMFRRQIGPWISERRFEHAQLAVESSRDSDGDSSYQLIVRTANDRRTIQSAVNDESEIVDCARWIAARTGFSLSPVRL
jgi:hypothetical protein